MIYTAGDLQNHFKVGMVMTVTNGEIEWIATDQQWEEYNQLSNDNA